jgi:hypothetical protein
MRQSRLSLADCCLFGSQCVHRIEARCAPRRNDTCEHGHGEQRCGNCDKDLRIERLDLIEQAAHQPAGLQACCESHNETEDRRPHSVEQHLPHHLFAFCTQCDADADLGRALRCEVRHYAEQSHRRKNQRQRGKSDEQRSVEALVLGRFPELLVHCELVGDGQIAVHLRNDPLYRESELLRVLAGANHKRAHVLDAGIQREVLHRLRGFTD